MTTALFISYISIIILGLNGVSLVGNDCCTTWVAESNNEKSTVNDLISESACCHDALMKRYSPHDSAFLCTGMAHIQYQRHTNPTAAPALPAGQATHEMAIPNDLIGCIIGRGGQKINEIR